MPKYKIMFENKLGISSDIARTQRLQQQLLIHQLQKI